MGQVRLCQVEPIDNPVSVWVCVLSFKVKGSAKEGSGLLSVSVAQHHIVERAREQNYIKFKNSIKLTTQKEFLIA